MMENIAEFADFLAALCGNRQNYILAYSGGMDSHVLLHVLVRLRDYNPQIKISAVHINHGLNSAASQWSEHCQRVCQQLHVDFKNNVLNLQPQAGDSIEAIARKARYQHLSLHVHEQSCLLTAQHQDDQAETVLLQLMRGAGPKGLAAMPYCQTFSTGVLCRPFLQITRSQLLKYAEKHQLEWVEDDSNSNIQFSRNYFRQQIMPSLRQRWPAVASSVARSARHCATTQLLLDELASEDLLRLTRHTASTMDATIDCQLLMSLSVPRQCNVLRYWFNRNHLQMPNEQRLLSFLQALANSAPGKNPQLIWGRTRVQRYRQRLHLVNLLQIPSVTTEITWDLQSVLVLPAQLGTLRVTEEMQGGIDPAIKVQSLAIRFGQQGVYIRLPGSIQHRPLKKLWQEWGVPPWQRGRIPLLYCNDELISVIGYCVAAEVFVQQQAGLVIQCCP